MRARDERFILSAAHGPGAAHRLISSHAAVPYPVTIAVGERIARSLPALTLIGDSAVAGRGAVVAAL